MKHYITAVQIALLGIVITVIVGIIVLFIKLTPLSIGDMEGDFNKNRANILLVMEYICTINYDAVTINSTDEAKILYAYSENGIGGKIQIDNIRVVNALQTLFDNGYDVIGKTANTYVYFQRWSDLDCGSGIVYSIDGSSPKLEMLTKLEPLSDENWYYYEEDYNEWRLQKP